jgi:hypothetical protein
MAALKNAKWEDYAQALAAGHSQRIAYRMAYPSAESWKDATVDSKASNLFKNDKVAARYTELKEAAAFMAGGAVLTRIEKRELLASMARDDTLPAADRQRAIDLDNKMEDEYTRHKDKEEQQARIDKLKAETSRIKGEEPDGNTPDDGFMEALQGQVPGIWQE